MNKPGPVAGRSGSPHNRSGFSDLLLEGTMKPPRDMERVDGPAFFIAMYVYSNEA